MSEAVEDPERLPGIHPDGVRARILRYIAEHPEGVLIADLLDLYGPLERAPRDYENNMPRQRRLTWLGNHVRYLSEYGLVEIARIDRSGYNCTPRRVWVATPKGRKFLTEVESLYQTRRERVRQAREQRVAEVQDRDERQQGVVRLHKLWRETRAQLMTEMRRQGYSLQEVGFVVGLSRERVRQLLEGEE